VVSLAVGDDFFVFGQPEAFEDLRHVAADAQVALFVHAGRPFEIHRAGDMPAFGCEHFLAGIFQRPTRIPDAQVGSPKTALQVFAGSGGAVMQREADWTAGRGGHVGGERVFALQPREQAAIQIVVFLVADHVEHPDKTPGPTTAFVVIDHVGSVGRMAQFAEQFLEISLAGQQAGCRCLAQLGALGVNEMRAGDVPFGVAGGTGEVHQNQVLGIQLTEQVTGFDHQRQAREVRHVRSPGHKCWRLKDGDCSASIRRCGW
jgi:hypothetical protein